MIDIDCYGEVVSGEPDLQKCRGVIDEIDRHICSLLLKRIRVVKKVAPIKARQNLGNSFFRVLREIEVIRNSLHRLQACYPKEFVIQLWRLLISTSLNCEHKFSIITYNKHCHWLAREYFGSFIESSIVNSSQDLINSILQDKSARVGCLPFPDFILKEKWWLHVMNGDLKVFAIYPLSKEDCLPPVLFLAAVTLEPTGSDSSLVVVVSECRDEQIIALLAKEGIVADVIDGQKERRLLIVDGFIDVQSQNRMARLLGADVKIIGAFTKKL